MHVLRIMCEFAFIFIVFMNEVGTMVTLAAAS